MKEPGDQRLLLLSMHAQAQIRAELAPLTLSPGCVSHPRETRLSARQQAHMLRREHPP